MATSDHLCPFGIKSRDLLKRMGFALDDNTLTSRAETDVFKEAHGVDTTPQIFIDGQRIGGYDDLREYLKLPQEGGEDTTYKPVIAIFGFCSLAALALSWAHAGTLVSSIALMWFVGLSMLVLAIQKLQDVTAFSNQFATYDLLSMCYVPMFTLMRKPTQVWVC